MIFFINRFKSRYWKNEKEGDHRHYHHYESEDRDQEGQRGHGDQREGYGRKPVKQEPGAQEITKFYITLLY